MTNLLLRHFLKRTRLSLCLSLSRAQEAVYQAPTGVSAFTLSPIRVITRCVLRSAAEVLQREGLLAEEQLSQTNFSQKPSYY